MVYSRLHSWHCSRNRWRLRSTFSTFFMALPLVLRAWWPRQSLSIDTHADTLLNLLKQHAGISLGREWWTLDPHCSPMTLGCKWKQSTAVRLRTCNYKVVGLNLSKLTIDFTMTRLSASCSYNNYNALARLSSRGSRPSPECYNYCTISLVLKNFEKKEPGRRSSNWVYIY